MVRWVVAVVSGADESHKHAGHAGMQGHAAIESHFQYARHPFGIAFERERSPGSVVELLLAPLLVVQWWMVGR